MQQNAVEFGASLVVWWLRLHAPNAGSQGSIPRQGTRSQRQQLKGSYMPKLKILDSQIIKQINILKKKKQTNNPFTLLPPRSAEKSLVKSEDLDLYRLGQ